MKKIILSAMLFASTFVTSCVIGDVYTGELNTPDSGSSLIETTFAGSIDGEVTIDSGEYTFYNITSGRTTVIDNTEIGSADLISGLYNVSFLGRGYLKNNTTRTEEEENTADAIVIIQGVLENAQITSSTKGLNMILYVSSPGSDFVFKEIFVSGTLTEAGSAYNGSQYLIIHNNSDKTLYADGLIFIESRFTTNTKYEYTPDVMSEAMAVNYMAMVAGSGTDYPIAAGESFVIADNAMLHTDANQTDLSGAMFEWHSDLSTVDVDNPNVPNLTNVYLATGNFWMANKQGSRAYVLGRLPEDVSVEQYLEGYAYNYGYTLASGYEMSQSAYKFPNEWILDGVNLAPSASFVWRVMDDLVDLGWTYQGSTTTTTANAGKAVIRKVDAEESAKQGRVVLKDTNNSSNDFDAIQDASLL